MPTITSHLHTAQLEHKRIFVRADTNTPQATQNNRLDDFRLQKVLPTLQLIKQKGGRIVLCSHISRPTAPSPEFSTQQLIPWFEKNGFKTVFAPTPQDAQRLSLATEYDIVLLENIRYWPEEEACDKQFAQQLAECADYYVNDAFGSCHRSSASLTVLPTLFNASDRSIGLLIEQELRHLHPLLTHPKHPFAVMIGGVKGETKIPLLHTLLSNLQALLITTPLCFTFFAAQGRATGKSYIEKNMIEDAQKLLEQAATLHIPVLFPQDFQVTEASFKSPKKIRVVKTLQPEHVGLSVGPETTQLFKETLLNTKTVFMNGLPGNPAYVETLESTRILLNGMRRYTGTCIIGGGDSVALVRTLGYDDVGYLSTGGGATLAYLSKKALPALAIFMQ